MVPFLKQHTHYTVSRGVALYFIKRSELILDDLGEDVGDDTGD